MIDLAPIKQRLNAIPAPPWREFCESGEWWIAQTDTDGEPLETICSSNTDDMDSGVADFLTAAPTDIQTLIAEVEQLRTALDTIGTSIYTRGRGTKMEQQLLVFIREQLGRA